MFYSTIKQVWLIRIDISYPVVAFWSAMRRIVMYKTNKQDKKVKKS